MSRLARPSILVLAAALALAPLPALAQEHDHAHAAEELGTVHFPIGCDAALQADFDRAMALLHSFGYEPARQLFSELAARDPGCAMAQWGIAMTLYHPIWAPPTESELAAGRAAAEAAAALGGASDREQAYIAAIGIFYRDADRLDHGARALAYRGALEDIVRRFPADPEAKIFYALALLGTAPPVDPDYRQQKLAAEILNGLLPAMPNHPGIAHYIIHSFDYPELAELALPAAQSYAKIAPASPHAQHMPSHIFTRLGLWQESIASNLASEQTANALVAQTHPGAASYNALHALDYLEYAYLQTCQEQEAREVLERARAAQRFDDAQFAAGYALTAIPARHALERERWTEAASLAVPEAEMPWERFSYALAITHQARSLGAAQTGDLATARAALEELTSIRDRLAQAPPAGPYDWKSQVESLRLAAAGWLAHVEGRGEEALATLREAAELEEATGKHPVTPGSVLPARELLAAALEAAGRPAEALAEYEASLAQAPNRLNALAGAARTAEAAGQTQRAHELWERILAQCDGGSAWPEVEAARAGLGK